MKPAFPLVVLPAIQWKSRVSPEQLAIWTAKTDFQSEKLVGVAFVKYVFG